MSASTEVVAATPDHKKHFTPEEDLSLWTHLISYPTAFPEASMNSIWEDFRSTHATRRSAKSLMSRFCRLSTKLHLTDFDNQTKADLCIRYRIHPDPALLEMLQQDMDVTLDAQGFIVNCVAKNNMKRPNIESSGPLIPRKILKTEVREEEPEEDLAFSSSQQPYALGSQDLSQDDEEEENSQSQGSDRGTNVGNEHEEPQLAPIVEQKIKRQAKPVHKQEMVMPSLAAVPNETQLTQSDFMPYLESFKKSFIEETHAIVQQTVGEALLKQKKVELEKPEKKISSKQFLKELKTLVSGFQSPALKGIEKRIDDALPSLETQDKEVPMDNIRLILELAVKMSGY